MTSRPLGIAMMILLVVAAIPTAESNEPALGLAVATTPGIVTVKTTTSDAPVSLNVVLTHDDPLAGVVVDRVVPLNVSRETSAALALLDLRASTNFTVRLISDSIPLPFLPNVTRVINGSRIPDLPILAESPVVGFSPEARNRTVAVPTYVIASKSAEDLTGLITTSTGLVVAPSMLPGRVGLRVSRDGGHSFGSPIHVADVGGSILPWWAFSEIGRGDGDCQVKESSRAGHPLNRDHFDA